MNREQHCDVTMRAGSIRGRWREDSTVRSAAFLGIPFAQAPIGDLRFAAPVPVEPWKGTRDALTYGPTPKRGEPDNSTVPETVVPGNETLNLNVFTPRPGDIGAGLPVLVWIHGGAYFAGSPASPWYDGKTYNRDGVVTVSLSYRLGFDGFGWIEGAPANRGVLDWIAGLEWVQENIREFGGDPARVTVAGQSAGGGAALTLLGMERAQHLFSSVHSISGALGDRPRQEAIEFAQALGERLGVAPSAKELRDVPEARLYEVQQELATLEGTDFMKSMVEDGPLVAPVIDGELINRPTLESLALGVGSDKGLMLGATDEEFTILVAGMEEELAAVPLPSLLESVGLSGEVRDAYMSANSEYAARGNAAMLGRYLTDGIFRATIVRVANARAAGSTWAYRFAFASASYGLSGHGLDVPFWFDCLDSDGVEQYTGPEPPVALAAAMHGSAVEFMTGGDPGWPAWTTEAGVSQVFGGEQVAQASPGEFNDVTPLLATEFRPKP